MKILALVPARSGSKRAPGKNIRLLGGKPLIAWSIEVTRGIDGVVDTLVSTDSQEIAKISNEFGALVPWLRPAELATDSASSADVAIHALDYYEREHTKVDALLLLQPTSPFRSRETVWRGIEFFQAHNRRPVVSVSKAAIHPMWCFRVEGSLAIPFIKESGQNYPSQDLPPAYALNGALYLIAPDDLRLNKSFVIPNMVPLIVDSATEAIDIDTEEDWQLAETCVASNIQRRVG